MDHLKIRKTAIADNIISRAGLSSQAIPKSFWTSLTTFAAARFVLALFLAGGQFIKQHANDDFLTIDENLLLGIAAGYVLCSAFLLGLTLKWKAYFHSQLLGQIALDLLILTLLFYASGGMRSGFAVLYLFPVAGAAVLGPLSFSLLAASVSTLLMLYEAGLTYLSREGDVPFMQSALFGLALFATAFLIHRFAVRLITQEQLAARRGLDLKNQLEINQLVIAEMQDGVLIVKKDGTIVTSNQKARDTLNLAHRAVSSNNLFQIPGLEKLGQRFQRWQQRMTESQFTQEHEVDFVLETGHFPTENVPTPSDSQNESTATENNKKTLRLRARFVEPYSPELAEDPSAQQVIIYLEDLGRIEDQAQQLKLASMGRLTASIAHEIRNPLAAISHANALLAEEFAEAGSPLYQRMTKIIQENVLRLNRIIEDVLQVSKKVRVDQEPLDLNKTLQEIVSDFLRDRQLPEALIQLHIEQSDQIVFDPFHFRQVLLNLLSNAQRYASGKPHSIIIQTYLSSRARLELMIRNDGGEIDPEIQQHLFEPFFTTASKGTGLGLYLARELCISNGAEIFYRSGNHLYATTPRLRSGGEFVINLKRWQTKWSDTIPFGQPLPLGTMSLDQPTVQLSVDYTEQPSVTDNRHNAFKKGEPL